MRFSLGTFVLIILFIASAYAVWWLNMPWYLAGVRTTTEANLQEPYGRELMEIMGKFGHFKNDITCVLLSPDGTRKLGSANRRDEWNVSLNSVCIYENTTRDRSDPEHLLSTDRALQTISATPAFAYFRSDSEIVLLKAANPGQMFIGKVEIYKRRHMENGWSSVARAEIWLMIITFALLVFRLIRHIQKARAAKSA